MSSFRCVTRFAVTAGLAAGLFACADDPVAPTSEPFVTEAAMSVNSTSPAPPAGLVDVGSLQIWPWTGRDLSGETGDPINLIFTGDVDVVSLRAALLSLDGDRTALGFPPSYPFNCTWTDAHGEMQTTYTDGAGWVGNAIQLQCGDYAPLRFHIRLLDAGDWVVAGVHFDLLIPDTPQHQVISWDLPQKLVMADFARSGLLIASPEDVVVTVPGPVQEIPKPIYDGIPDDLKFALGLPSGPASGSGVPVQNDGMATVLTIGTAMQVTAGRTEYTMSMPFDQTVPRPFCSQGPTDYVHIQGPVDITVRTVVNKKGRLESHNTLSGDLEVTPINIFTGSPSGPTFKAKISQIDNTGVGPNGTSVNAIQHRKALPPGVGFLKTHLVTSPNGTAHFTYSEKCN
jgi:hypothetical protein